MSVSIAVILDTRRIKENNKYPVKLRVNFQRITNFYPTIYDFTKADYQKLSAPRISEELQAVRKKFKEIESTALKAVEKLIPFTFESFEKAFISANPNFKQRRKKTVPKEVNTEDGFDYSPYLRRFSILQETECKPGTLTWWYQQYIKRLIREDRIGSAVAYHCSYVSLKSFKSNLLLSDVTVSFLCAYEKDGRAKSLSKSTIGIYLRPLRAIFNDVIAQGFLKKDVSYPFGIKKYQIPTAKKIKKALDLDDIKQIYFYRCTNENSSEQMAKDYWLFSYFGNGMNPKDMALLQWKNLVDDYITFERAKTERALRGAPVSITVYVNEDMKAIMARWGNNDRSSNNYMFPVLQHGLSALRIYDRIQNFVYFINYWMKEILRNLNIDKKATTYVARHTFSTVLKRSGASIEQIQEALGYTDTKTTEGYIDSFDKETKKQMAGALIAFKESQSTL